MNLRQTERAVIVASRLLTLIAVLGSLVGSFLMFLPGLYYIYAAIAVGLRAEADGRSGIAAIISVIGAHDRFLIAIVLLYFSYGVYSLFIHPEEPEERLAIPDWLRRAADRSAEAGCDWRHHRRAVRALSPCCPGNVCAE